MNIALVPYTQDYLIPVDGKYLVRTESLKFNTPNYHWVKCKRVLNEKKGVYTTSIQVSNQTVTHISIEPLLDDVDTKRYVGFQSGIESIPENVTEFADFKAAVFGSDNMNCFTTVINSDFEIAKKLFLEKWANYVKCKEKFGYY